MGESGGRVHHWLAASSVGDLGARRNETHQLNCYRAYVAS